jgi:general stress protein YciG
LLVATQGEGREPEEAARHRPEDTTPVIGSRGGQAVVNKYGKEHMAEIGRKGSKAVVKKYGLRFYSEIAARNKGVKKRRGVPAEPQA